MPLLSPTYNSSPTFKSFLQLDWQLETYDFRDRVIANGGTISVATLKAVNAYIVAQKAAEIWDKIYADYIFVGDNLAAALTPLKVGGGLSLLTNTNFVAGDYTEATGLHGKDTAYLKTGITNRMLTSSVGLLITLGCYYGGAPATSYMIGSSSASPRFLLICNSGGRDAGDLQDASIGLLSAAGQTGSKCSSESRTALNRADFYINGAASGTPMTSAQTVTITNNTEFYLFNRQALTAGAYFTGYVKHMILGGAFTAAEHLSWYTNSHALQTAFGRQN